MKARLRSGAAAVIGGSIAQTAGAGAPVDGLIKEFYAEECSILAGSIRRGIELGVFREVDTERAALLASTHLDGIMVASMIREDYDLQVAMTGLKRVFWEHLGHDRPAAKPRARQRSPRAAN